MWCARSGSSATSSISSAISSLCYRIFLLAPSSSVSPARSMNFSGVLRSSHEIPCRDFLAMNPLTPYGCTSGVSDLKVLCARLELPWVLVAGACSVSFSVAVSYCELSRRCKKCACDNHGGDAVCCFCMLNMLSVDIGSGANNDNFYRAIEQAEFRRSKIASVTNLQLPHT